MANIVLLFVVIALGIVNVSGHGMLLDPINRASRWREHEDAPINYDDNALFCGGRAAQWDLNDGKCGLCGDDFADSTPRRNELGGEFGQGVIVKSYKSGDDLNVNVLITANHLGYFTFALCNLDESGEESEECFDSHQLTLTDGRTKYEIGSEIGYYDVSLQVPENLVCEHCVLQWTYTTGNSWGVCEDNTQAMGCGAQETFRTCSDISIA